MFLAALLDSQTCNSIAARTSMAGQSHTAANHFSTLLWRSGSALNVYNQFYFPSYLITNKLQGWGHPRFLSSYPFHPDIWDMFFAAEHGLQVWGVNIAVRLPYFHILSPLSYQLCVKTVTLSFATFLWALIVYRRTKHISVSHIPGPCPESFILGKYSA